MQATSSKPRRTEPNRFQALNDMEEDEEETPGKANKTEIYDKTNPDSVLEELRKKIDKSKPSATKYLRDKLRKLCKGRAITAELQKELQQLGYDKAELTPAGM